MTQELRNVKGLPELQRFLDQLPVKLQRNVLRGAARAGLKVFRDEARANVPVAAPSNEGRMLYGGYRGALRDSIRVSVKVRNGEIIGKVIAGGRNKKTGADVFYAHIVEYGARPHTITAWGRKHLSVGGLFFQSVDHPGVVQPRPFMTPAFDIGAERAITAFGTYVRDRLASKHGLETAGIEIGVEA